MFRFAFIENVPGTTPETYSCVHENKESYNIVAGTQSFQMTEDLVKKLDAEGIDTIDLCGDFTADDAAKLAKAVKGKVQINYAGYLPAEMKKMDNLQFMKEYGIVVVTEGMDETAAYELKNKECNTYVRFTKDLEAAKQAAAELVNSGVNFIELCSFFDEVKTQAVIDAISGKVPVGSCGV